MEDDQLTEKPRDFAFLNPVLYPVIKREAVRPAVFVFFFLAGLCFASWASRIPDIKIKLHLSEAQLGSILLALPAGSWTALPFSGRDRKSTRLNSSHRCISYAVFCL